MDSRYQVVLLDTRTGRFRPAAGSGRTALQWNTLEQAQADFSNWNAMFTPQEYLRLAVQRIDCSLVPGTEVTCDGRPVPGTREKTPPMIDTDPTLLDKPRVILESPFAGADLADRELNIAYGRAAMRDALRRGEAPIASHLLYTQPGVLDDDDPHERRMGMTAGFAWLAVVDYAVVYTDRGISPGMEEGIARARALGLDIHHRTIDEW